MPYAVRCGKKPGIYDSWDQCAEQVLGFKNAAYKKFETMAEAVTFVGTGNIGTSSGTKVSSQSAARPVKAPTSLAATKKSTISLRSARSNSTSTISVSSKLSSHGSEKPPTALGLPTVAVFKADTSGNLAVHTAKSVCSSSSSTSTSSSGRKDTEVSDVCCANCGGGTAIQHSQKTNANQGRPYHRCNSCQAWVGWAAEDLADKMDRKRKAAEATMQQVQDASRGLLVYTDGACLGNRNVATSRNPAGWGICAMRIPALVPEAELYGPVILDQASPFHIGAAVASNNTAELSAIGEALIWLCEDVDTDVIRDGVVCMCYDSEYAHSSVVGIFNGEKNRELIMNIRGILRAAEQRLNKVGARLTWKHVKGHSNEQFNDRADHLAGLGARGELCKVGRYFTKYATGQNSLKRSHGI